MDVLLATSDKLHKMLAQGSSPKGPKYLYGTKYGFCSSNFPYGLGKYSPYGYLGPFGLVATELALGAAGLYRTRSRVYSPAQVDRIWGIWGSYFNIPKAIFCLLKGDYRFGVQSGKGHSQARIQCLSFRKQSSL